MRFSQKAQGFMKIKDGVTTAWATDGQTIEFYKKFKVKKKELTAQQLLDMF